ncbi:MAG: hypothetical protein ABEK59_09035 [Halobacteria archaeon]
MSSAENPSIWTQISKTPGVARSVVARYPKFFFGVAVGYLLIYLFMVNNLNFHPGQITFDLRVASNPLDLAFRNTGVFSFESIAVLKLPFLTLMVSPLNLLIGGVIAVLVSLNLSFTYSSYREPAACSTRNVGGALSALPALLTGSACCAPLLFIVLGIQASATLLTAQRILLPLAVILLLASLPVAARNLDPKSISEAS